MKAWGKVKKDVDCVKCCASCGFGKVAQDEGYIICKRFPPTVVNEAGKTFFPIVKADEVCGEFKNKKI